MATTAVFNAQTHDAELMSHRWIGCLVIDAAMANTQNVGMEALRPGAPHCDSPPRSEELQGVRT